MGEKIGGQRNNALQSLTTLTKNNLFVFVCKFLACLSIIKVDNFPYGATTFFTHFYKKGYINQVN